MRVGILTIVLWVSACNAATYPTKPCVTFTLPRGRLGNKLIAYAKALYVAEKYGFNLLVPHFPYADQLLLSRSNKPFQPSDTQAFTTIRYIYCEEEITEKDTPTILYITNFTFKCDLPAYCAANRSFKKTLQHMIRPTAAIVPTNLPINRITIAIHIRTGGDYDAQRSWMLKKLIHKFPPLSAYIKTLEDLLLRLKKWPSHIHIFTDHSRPEELVQEFNKVVSNKNVTISYRKDGNHHAAHVLEDLFAMTQYDYLIRPHSTYSIIAQLIGNHRQVLPVQQSPAISPTSRES